LRDRDVGARDAGEHAGNEQHGDGPGDAEQEVADGGAREAHEDDDTTPEAIGKSAPDRGEEQLHQGVDANQRPCDEGRRMQPLGVRRQQRDHDPEAHQIDENGQEEDDERRALEAGG